MGSSVVILFIKESCFLRKSELTHPLKIKRIRKNINGLFNLFPIWGTGKSGQMRTWIKIISIATRSIPISNLNIKSRIFVCEGDKIILI